MQERFEAFTVLINRISRNIRRIKNQEMAKYNLRSAHVSCLYYLNSSPGLTATDLCGRCAEDKATISRALDHLEEQGYLAPRPKGQKRYNSALALTEKGDRAGEVIARKVEGVFAGLTPALTPEERQCLYRCLTIICQGLEQVCQDSKEQGEAL